MLQTMRSSAKFVFWILAVAFIGGFLLVETSGLLGSSPVTPTTAVATVNGRDILYTEWQRRIQQAVQQAQQQSARSLTQDELRRIENQAYDELVAEILLQQEYEKRGIVVSVEELRDYARFAPPPWVQNAPDLQTDGTFDPAKYQRLLTSSQARQSGLLAALEQYFRSEVPKEKLFQQITSGLFVTDADLWRSWQDANDSASITFVSFRPTPAGADTVIADADLRSYYNAHKAEFERPGNAVVSVMYIPRVVTAADSAGVRARILALRAEIVGGTRFEDVAKRESIDSVSAALGGDMGMGAKGRFVTEFDQVAHSLPVGGLSQPVLTQFGYHLIRVDSKKGDSVSVRHILLGIHPSDSGATRIDRRADSLASLVAGSIDQPAKWDAAAKTLGLTPFKVQALENQPAVHEGRQVPSVSAWAFSGARAGEVSDLFDADDGYYVARLDTLGQGGNAFDAVKPAVRARVAADRAIERAIPSADALSKAARSSSLEAAAAAAGLSVTKTGMTNRAGASSSFGSLGEAVGAAFVQPLNEVSAPVRQRDGVFVLRTDGRRPSDRATFDAEKKDLRLRRLQQLRQQRLQMYLDDLRKSAKISDKRKEINAQIRRQSADA